MELRAVVAIAPVVRFGFVACLLLEESSHHAVLAGSRRTKHEKIVAIVPDACTETYRVHGAHLADDSSQIIQITSCPEYELIEITRLVKLLRLQQKRIVRIFCMIIFRIQYFPDSPGSLFFHPEICHQLPDRYSSLYIEQLVCCSFMHHCHPILRHLNRARQGNFNNCTTLASMTFPQPEGLLTIEKIQNKMVLDCGVRIFKTGLFQQGELL